MKGKFSYLYKGKVPVKAGEKVDVLVDEQEDKWMPVRVIDPLGSQFTVRGPNKQVKFFFYGDKGITWRKKATGVK